MRGFAFDERIATDPPVSEAQRRAMYAAREGRSTLGIPKKVGEEFVGKAHDGTDLPVAAGVVFVAPDGEVLLLRRASTEENYAGHWALPGGKADEGESAEDAAARECREEVGGRAFDGEAAKLKPMRSQATPNGMAFHTFARPVADKFTPQLNGEHSGYAWAPLDMLPKPLHPSVESTLGEELGVTADMSPDDWSALRANFAKWTREEEAEPEHRAHDERLALDRKSVRHYDSDGHLIVNRAPISKANVCEYLGSEIPGAEEMGLDPNRKYALLRDPKELEKAAATSNGKKLMIVHVPVSPDDPHKESWVGSVGTSAEYVHPYLYNALSVTEREGIDAIESGEQRELSSGYRYRADMTPGVYLGVPYDGVMRDIEFNHVALVEEGRAGADVVVGDGAIREGTVTMPKTVLSRKGTYAAGVLVGYLLPKLAHDKKLDLGPLLEGVTQKNFKDKKAGIAAALTKAVTPMLAKDATMGDVHELLDKIEKHDVTEGADADPSSGLPLNAEEMKKKAEDEEKAAKDKRARDAKEFLKGKLSAEDMAAYDELVGEHEEAEDSESERAEENEEGREGGGGEDEEPKVTKKAMDAAIIAAVTATRKSATSDAIKLANQISTAREFVAPWVGKLAMDAAAPEEVYKAALDALKVDVTGVHASAYKKILELQPQPGQRERIAQDSARAASDATGFNGRWGKEAGRIALA